MREAAQGHVLALTELLPPETAAELVEWYRGNTAGLSGSQCRKRCWPLWERRGKGPEMEQRKLLWGAAARAA